MQKSTKIIRVDVKRGSNCRTPSTISIGIDKSDLANVLEYMDAYESSEAPTGKIKRIELVMYDDDDMMQQDIIEGLEKQIKELTGCLENVDIVADNSAPLIDRIKVEDIPEWETGIYYQDNTKVMFEGKVCLVYGENNIPEPIPEEKEDLPVNQPNLPLDKKCECGSNCFVDGKCSNCGGLE